MMQKSQVLQKLKISLVFIALLALFSNNAFFANTYNSPNVIVGPASGKNDTFKIDEANFAFESFSQIMSYEDNLKAITMISEFRKGDKSYEANLVELIRKYNPIQPELIAHYMLYDNLTQLVAAYIIDHKNNVPVYVRILGLTPEKSKDQKQVGDEAWAKFSNLIPDEFKNNIDTFYLELNKSDDSMINICEIDDKGKKWAVYADMRLFLSGYENYLFKHAVYSSVYYYILRNDQIDFNPQNSKCYSYGKHTYKKDSYINVFYERFWKGRRKELNTGQASMYPNEFINDKASRTVYDDMAVSFYTYLTEGAKGTEKIRDQKILFFKNYGIFNALQNFYIYKASHK